MKLKIIIALLFIISSATFAQSSKSINLADPTIFLDGDIYYLYGTGRADGFGVYTSTNLTDWTLHDKNALQKGDSYGSKGFWAPQIFKNGSKYFMAYAADEHVAIAESASPLGPFKQLSPHSISVEGKHIDPYIFKDTDGKLYLYFVRLQNGNRIFVARLKDDLSDIDSTTVTECLHAESGWENTLNAAWPVSEGPTVIKLDGLYYLFYSANDFRNIDYAVGYATAKTPFGPWTKSTGNPIISRNNTGQNGSGHGDLCLTKDQKFYYVLHTHESNEIVGKRKTAIVQLTMDKTNPRDFKLVPSSFRYLQQLQEPQENGNKK